MSSSAPAADPALDLRKEAVQSVAWNTGFGLFRDLLQFGMMLVLVRLITPEAYGQFGLVTSIIGFFTILGCPNFIAHTLQLRGGREPDYQVHFTAGGFLQTTLFLLANLAALLLRRLPDFAAVAPLVHVASISLLLEWPTELRAKMLERQLDWQRRRLLHAAGLVLNAVTAIAMALYGLGVYALIVPGMLVSLPFIWDLFVSRRWRPSWEWSWHRYAAAARFGAARLVTGVAVQGRRLVESSGLAALLSFSVLGYFGRAVGLSQILCGKFAAQLLYALYPVLTKIPPGSESYRRSAALVLRLVLWTMIPAALLGSLLGGPLVDLIYGRQWPAVVPMMPWALAVAALAALTQTQTTLLLANDRERWCAAIELLSLALTAVAVWKLAPHGAVAYLGALVALGVVTSAVSLLLLHASGAVRAASALGSALSGGLAGLAALAVAMLVERSLPPWSPVLRLPLVALVFGLVYVLTLRLVFARQLRATLRYAPAGRTVGRLLLLSPDNLRAPRPESRDR